MKQESGEDNFASYRHIDCLVQALGSGCAPKKSLSYGNKEVRVDVCAVPPEHGAFLHLGSNTRDGHYTQKLDISLCQQPELRASDTASTLGVQHDEESTLTKVKHYTRLHLRSISIL